MTTDRGALLPTLERLFAGPREQVLTVGTLLAGLEARSYAFIIAVLDLPNCVPTGIPLLSTVTGIPMLLFAVQDLLGRPAPALPGWLADRSLSRGRLQDSLGRLRGPIGRLENLVHPRHEWWLRGRSRRPLEIAWVGCICVLALPIPFDNLFAAWAILFFCLAFLERDGVMAMVGWCLTFVTALWTLFLLWIGPYVVWQAVKTVF